MSRRDEPIPYSRETKLVIRQLKKEEGTLWGGRQTFELAAGAAYAHALLVIAETHRQWMDYHHWQKRLDMWRNRVSH